MNWDTAEISVNTFLDRCVPRNLWYNICVAVHTFDPVLLPALLEARTACKIVILPKY